MNETKADLTMKNVRLMILNTDLMEANRRLAKDLERAKEDCEFKAKLLSAFAQHMIVLEKRLKEYADER